MSLAPGIFRWTRTPTVMGTVYLATTGTGLFRIELDTNEARFVGGLRASFPAAALVRDDVGLRDLAAEVARRADGEPATSEITLDLHGSEFQLRVWNALARIPRGSVETYGAVAESIGAPGAARAVGSACGANPVSIVVPCHRVVPTGGGVGNYGWGPDRKRELLRREGRARRTAVTMLAMRFDLRLPPFATTSRTEQYHACLGMCDWAEQHGFVMLAFSEHHGVDDGYLPAPLTVATAVLARTERIPVTIAALLMPLHDPVRLAEQLAVIDLCAPGRLNIIAGLGYRPEEFEMAGVDRRRRAPLAEESIGVLRSAWTGEPFEWRGRTVRVTPEPATPGGPTIFVGGSVEAAAPRRAARLGCGFFAAVADPALEAAYREECERVGYEHPFFAAPSGPSFQMVSEDPDRTWSEIGPHALYDVATYSAWQDGSQRSTYEVHDATDWEQVRASGVYQVLTPDEMVESIRQTGAVMLHPLMGGIEPELAWRSLELFDAKVLPQIT